MKIEYKETFKEYDEAILAIEEYMKRYHPAGYSTKVTCLSLGYDGWTLKMSRWSSCD